MIEAPSSIRILVTGAGGFIGSALLERLRSSWTGTVRGSVRRPCAGAPDLLDVGDIAPDTDWSRALAGIDAVVHTAGRAHAQGSQAECRRVNALGSLRLARQAAAAGVKRLIFLSSIKVNGEQTAPGRPFTPEDEPTAADAYAESKLEAERGLLEIARETGIETVVIRPALVYGPGVKGNLLTVMRLLRLGIPLPLASIDNRRSLLALDNLIDLIVVCLRHPAAANETFLAADGEDLSTTELLRRIGAALGTGARLFSVPRGALSAGASLLGRHDLYRRLCGSLQVDIAKCREMLDWHPSSSMDESIRAMAQRFLGDRAAA